MKSRTDFALIGISNIGLCSLIYLEFSSFACYIVVKKRRVHKSCFLLFGVSAPLRVTTFYRRRVAAYVHVLTSC